MKFKTLFERMNALEEELLRSTEKPRGHRPEEWALFDRYYDQFRVVFARDHARGNTCPEEQAPAAMVIDCFSFYTWYQRAYENRTGLPADPWDE